MAKARTLVAKMVVLAICLTSVLVEIIKSFGNDVKSLVSSLDCEQSRFLSIIDLVSEHKVQAGKNWHKCKSFALHNFHSLTLLTWSQDQQLRERGTARCLLYFLHILKWIWRITHTLICAVLRSALSHLAGLGGEWADHLSPAHKLAVALSRTPTHWTTLGVGGTQNFTWQSYLFGQGNLASISLCSFL